MSQTTQRYGRSLGSAYGRGRADSVRGHRQPLPRAACPNRPGRRRTRQPRAVTRRASPRGSARTVVNGDDGLEDLVAKAGGFPVDDLVRDGDALDRLQALVVGVVGRVDVDVIQDGRKVDPGRVRVDERGPDAKRRACEERHQNVALVRRQEQVALRRCRAPCPPPPPLPSSSAW